MAKNKWTKMPFDSIEEARGACKVLGGQPTAVIVNEEKRLRYFQAKDGRNNYIVGQNLDGGSVMELKLARFAPRPPLQDPNAPTTSDRDLLLASTWTRSEHQNLDELREHYRKTFVNPDNLEWFTIYMVKVDADEYEYLVTSTGFLVRILSPRE